MSLAVLLNKEDKDISDFSKATADEPPTSNKSERVADAGVGKLPDKRQAYLSRLNSEFDRIKKRDSIEQLYQDWKFVNLQEFELISEWNQQSKDWQFDNTSESVDLHFKKLYRDMSSINKEWAEYQTFKNTNLSDIINEKDADEDEDEDEDDLEDGDEAVEQEDQTPGKHANGKNVHANGVQKSKKKDSTAAAGRAIKKEQDNVDAVAAVNGDDNEGDGDGDDNDDDNDDDDDDDDDDNDDDEEEEDEMEELEEEDFAAFEEQDDNDDEDFNPDGEKRRKRSSSSSSSTKLSMNSLSLITSKKINKNITIDSDRPKIVRELIKMCNKNKHQKIKKRRFTNCIVTDYNPIDSKLNIKITLKQYHVKRLKKLINDAKREREREEALKNNVDLDGNDLDNDEDGPESQKRRKLNNSNVGATDDPNKRKFNTRHGLPTYGMKMNAKEARAIQRHYDNTYTTIWKDMARKDSAKMSRLVQQMQSIRSTNFRKTSSLCAREAKKWQSKNFKQIKDFQTRARRGIREMSNFWKKNEREERDLKKKIEKEAMELAKKEEEEKESKRQAKKLNFLLTQTELYSHFIGRKIKTDELEGNGASNNSSQNHKNIDISALVPNKNDFHSIDFDNENDEQLRQRAAENASNALAETRAKAKQFDAHANAHGGEDEEDDEDELNFQNPTSLGEITIEQPKSLACTLKEYQLKGLNWLANLYDQSINGILADEMGLGKTVQSISVLAHLAENHNIWGPFLVVTPASTLHNWVNEISKFLPEFKILPYWGNANDRKVLRKFWDRKNLRYNKNAPFHVMITSYQMVVTDANYLQKMKWQYMILDEAQAIKSSQSSRWKNLLSFHCRNRLLLTGTPIQNSMQELWALLHFIMPSLFDSHDEFNEWFSKDIESHAEANTKLNQQQLRRLHMILKPFMLRRVKKNVQSELGDKIEIDVLCNLTQRQAKLYQVLKSQISTNYDAIENAATNDSSSNSTSSSGSDQNLINAVMQFRKVCNHPDLFERADVDSPFSFTTFGKTTSMLTASVANNNSTVVNNSNMNLSSMSSNNISNGKFTDLIYSSRNPIMYNLPRLVYDDLILPNYNNNVDIVQKIQNVKFNIFNTSINYELCLFLSKLTGESSLNEFFRISNTPLLKKIIEFTDQPHNPNSLMIKSKTEELLRLSKNTPSKGVLASLLNIKQLTYEDEYLNSVQRGYHPNVSAPPITIEVLGSSHISNSINNDLFDPIVTQALSDIPTTTQYNMHINKKIPIESFPRTGLFPEPLNKHFSSNISMPSMDRFITESAKLRKLDELLVKLKAEGHRVLIYFQMTKMMDLMEEYLTYKQYNHIRLDGSSKLEDRRDLVHDWQTNPEIFVFLLSTRAGGLGINLTAADTVIFYDSDWNPTIDSQAMDRAHRLGQTRQVTVYRLLVRGTIEERMRDRAKQKEQVQQVVMEGKTQEKNIKTIEVGENDSDVTSESDKNIIQNETKARASALA